MKRSVVLFALGCGASSSSGTAPIARPSASSASSASSVPASALTAASAAGASPRGSLTNIPLVVDLFSDLAKPDAGSDARAQSAKPIEPATGQAPLPQALPQPALTPAERAACAAKGGSFRPVCMSQSLLCVVPYPDGGKPCTDASQCMGGCFITDFFPDPSTKVTGECRRTNDPCGCRAPVASGHASSWKCTD